MNGSLCLVLNILEEIEKSVVILPKNAHLFYTLSNNILQPAPYLFNRKILHIRTAYAAYAESAAVKTSSGGFNLYKCLIPIEKRGLFWGIESIEILCLYALFGNITTLFSDRKSVV